MLRFSFAALLGQALAEDINVDLRLLAANGTNATKPLPTANGTNATTPLPAGNGTKGTAPNDTYVSASVAFPQTFDLGLGANATQLQKASAVRILCENPKFIATSKKSMFTLLSESLPGLLEEHVSGPTCKLASSRLRQLAAAASGSVDVSTSYEITAPKTSAFAKTLDAKKGTDSLANVLAKELVVKLKASKTKLASIMASAMQEAAKDPAFQASLAADPVTATLAAAIVKAAKEITATAIAVKTDEIKGMAAGSTTAVDATGYTPQATPATKSTSGAATTAVAALAAVLASALLF